MTYQADSEASQSSMDRARPKSSSESPGSDWTQDSDSDSLINISPVAPAQFVQPGPGLACVMAVCLDGPGPAPIIESPAAARRRPAKMKMQLGLLLLVCWIVFLQAADSFPKMQIRRRGFKSMQESNLKSVPLRIRKNITCPVGQRQRPPQKQRKAAGISKNALSELSINGANVTKCPGEALYMIDNIRFGDAAWKIFEKFAESVADKPSIFVAFGPPPSIWNTSAIPPDSQVCDIVHEAKSIRSRYAKLDISAFAGVVVPAIPGPDSSTFSITEEFCTPTLALSKLFGRIQNPDQPEYPVLSSLPSGSYICTVVHMWKNASIAIQVFKP